MDLKEELVEQGSKEVAAAELEMPVSFDLLYADDIWIGLVTLELVVTLQRANEAPVMKEVLEAPALVMPGRQ